MRKRWNSNNLAGKISTSNKQGLLSPISPDKITSFQNHPKRIRLEDAKHLLEISETSDHSEEQSITSGFEYFSSTSAISESETRLQSSKSASNETSDDKREKRLKEKAFELLEHSVLENRQFRSEFGLLKVLGWGGVGVVVEALQMKSSEMVAVKIIRRKKKDPAELLMKKLRHKNIIKLNRTFCDEKAYYLVLERFGKSWAADCEFESFKVRGPNFHLTIPIRSNTSATLFEYIENSSLGRVSSKFLKSLFSQVASAVCYLHSIRIVHSDLKEENILIDDIDGRLVAKICDFGHAFQFNGTPKMKLYGTRVLTPPELLRHLNTDNGENHLVTGFEQDIWALGLLLYTMIFGQLPPENEEFIDGNYTLDDYQYFPTNFDNIKDEDCNDLVRGMLYINPDLRYTADEVMRHSYISSLNNNGDSVTRHS